MRTLQQKPQSGTLMDRNATCRSCISAAGMRETLQKNRSDAIRFCRFAIDEGYIPMATHLLYPQILNDADPADRDLGLYFGWVLINKCNEVWVFSDGTISPGMKKEIIRAKSRNMKIRRFDLNCVEEG
jgi:hypothetical protein